MSFCVEPTVACLDLRDADVALGIDRSAPSQSPSRPVQRHRIAVRSA